MVGRQDDIVTYQANQSHTDPGSFVRVWNFGTPEFKAIEPIFERLSFSQVNCHLALLGPSDHGNQQEALGFSTQNLSSRCPQTNVAIPGLNTGTTAFREEFAKMSALAVHVHAIDEPGQEVEGNSFPAMGLFRWAKFASTIHPWNLLEGK